MRLRHSLKSIDWKILIFLLLFLNVKLIIKLVAVIFICAARFDFKFGFRFKNSRLPLFYPLIILIGVFNWVLYSQFTNLNYSIALLTGISSWFFCIVAIHQVKLSVELNTRLVIHQTVKVFFIINAIVSIAAYMLIVFKTGAINPYLYQGEYQKYFIRTGDYIRGVSFDTSTTNSVLNAFGVIYFLHQKKATMALLCMAILLVTGSNVTNVILSVVLLFIFFFQSDRNQKSLIVICFLLLVIFMVKVSPQNNQYIVNYFEKILDPDKTKSKLPSQVLSIRETPDSILSPEDRKLKIAILSLDSLHRAQIEKQNSSATTSIEATEKPVIPGDSIHTPKFQHVSFITPVEENMVDFIQTHPSELQISSDHNFHPLYPGKLIAWQQTFEYLKQHPEKIITGAGIGNFSSKLAFRTSGIKVAGSYPERFKYISKAFLENHLDLYLYYFSKDDGLHSVVNNPSSVYDQLLSEYGVAGLFAFCFFYIGFFLRRYNVLTYGVSLIFLLSAIFFIDYWFEQLSIVVFFELLLFLNIKEDAQKL